MKVPLPWLKEYIPTKLGAAQIADLLTSVGLEVEGIHDSVLEISLTPNLSHCASIRGIARELKAVTQEPLHLPKFAGVERGGDPIEKHTSVTVENPEGCPRYACRLIQGVRVAPSPSWLQERLEQCGMRSVNNIVDITNLVLLELGQPLHAFDFDKLEGRRIVVRSARKGEKIVTLDEKECYPTEDTLLICDAKNPVALAGIMGSLHAEVGDHTTTILLESAYFDPSTVRKASKRMGIQSEASYRFERGTDPNGVLEALERATSWICELAGGVPLQGAIDIKQRDFHSQNLSCRLTRINRLLGTQLAMSEVETLFKRLEFHSVKIHDDLITVQIPTYRHDMRHEIDLVEEAARLYGYDNIHKKEKAFYRSGLLPHNPEYLFEKKVRARLIAEGLQELLTCDLISPEQAALISTDNFPTRTWIKLLNPQSVDQSIMRPSMLPGMLSVVKYNADHSIESVAGFEVGRVHFTSKEKYVEPTAISIVLTGERHPTHWDGKEEKVDFFDLKGIITNFFEGLKLPRPAFIPSNFTNFHPGRQSAILIQNVEVGIMGEVHPLTLKQAKLDNPVYFAELNLEDLHRSVKETVKMEPLPQFPASVRDWTVTVSDHISIGRLSSWIEEEPSDLLESFSLRGLYTSDKLGSDRKNVTFRFIYRDKTKTLSFAAVENEHLRITNKISEHLK